MHQSACMTVQLCVNVYMQFRVVTTQFLHVWNMGMMCVCACVHASVCTHLHTKQDYLCMHTQIYKPDHVFM